MARGYKKFIGLISGGRGQALFLLIIFAVGAVMRFTFYRPQGLELAELSFSSSTASFQGTVVYSDVDQDLYLVLDGGSLFWRRGEENIELARDVVNLLVQEKQIWLKTATNINELICSTGAVVPQLNATSPDCQDIPFAQSRLVGKDKEGFYLHSGQVVQGIGSGEVKGSYFFEGRRKPPFIERDWRQGVAFIQGKSWRVYVDLLARFQVEPSQGMLRDIVLSPSATHIVYAIQRESLTEVWYARVSGADAELLYKEEMQFSDLKALWSPNQGMMVVSILGYQGEGSFSDDFCSATFLFQPRKGMTVLSKFQGQEIKALIPTAWDTRAPLIWFNWLHEEQPVPVSYQLFSRHQ